MDALTISPPTPALRAARLTRRRKILLAIEILTSYARVRWLLATREVVYAVNALRGGRNYPQVPEGDHLYEGIRLGRRIGRTLRMLPTDSRCLVRSCVLTSLLAKRGIGSTLVIGVKPEPSFEAHAWVESCGVALLDPGSSDYRRLLEL